MSLSYELLYIIANKTVQDNGDVFILKKYLTVCLTEKQLLNLQIIAIIMYMKRINRLKVVRAEQGKTGKW